MKNCLTCDQSLENGIVSAKNEKGTFYVACAACGQVYVVTTNSIGLTSIEKTRSTNDLKTIAQMQEAMRLFNEAGVSVESFKTNYFAEKETACKLDDRISDDELEFIKSTRERLMSEMANKEEVPSLEELVDSFVSFRERFNEGAGLIGEILEKMLGMTDEEEDEEEDEEVDCDGNCDGCSCHPDFDIPQTKEELARFLFGDIEEIDLDEEEDDEYDDEDEAGYKVALQKGNQKITVVCDNLDEVNHVINDAPRRGFLVKGIH